MITKYQRPGMVGVGGLWNLISLLVLGGGAFADHTFAQQVETGQSAAARQDEEKPTQAGVDPKAIQAATTEAKQFFALCSAGDVDQLLSLMTDELKQEVDRPMLATFAGAIRDRLGKLEVFGEPTVLPEDGNPKSFSLSTDAMFEFGLCQPTFGFENGKLSGFNIDSVELNGWFAGVDTIDDYRELGERFIRLVMEGDADGAFALCHPVLQEQVADGKLAAMITPIREKIGDLQSIEFNRPLQEIQPDSQKLYLYYRIVGSKGTFPCLITIQFAGLKGHFVGFMFD